MSTPTRPGATSPQDLVEHALAASTTDHCFVVVEVSTSANLRWANNTLTTNGEMRGQQLSVVAFVNTTDGTAVGSVSGSPTTAGQVADLVAAADAAARASAPAEDAAPLTADRVSPDWDEPPAATSIGVYSEVAPRLGEAFSRAGGSQRVLYGFANHEVSTTYVGSSTGLRLRHVQPTGHLAMTGKPTDLSQSAWVGRATRDFADIDPLAVDDELARRLAWGSRRIDLPAGRYDTILPSAAVADLMILAYWSAGARTAWDGQSVYSRRPTGTRIGEQVARPEVTLYSDPAHPGLESSPHVVATSSGNDASVFDTGLPLARTDWIRDGELSSLIQTRHTAEMTGQSSGQPADQPTTSYVDNLVLDVAGGSGDVADLVAGTVRGLLLTCMWYIREVDPQSLLLTGLTRDGVYLVEHGEITGVVNNFRWNESPVDLLGRFSAASATEPSFSREWGDDYFSRTATPALRVPDFNMSSVSPAQ